MNELTVWLSDEEVGLIGNELNRLFLFQDRPFSKDKQAAFLDEIRGWGFPAGAIISGIRKLMAEDLKSLKLATIRETAGQFVHHDESEKKSCDHCEKRGVILMRDESGYEFAFACPCVNGNHARSQGLCTWSGTEVQIHRGKTFTLRFLDAVKKGE